MMRAFIRIGLAALIFCGLMFGGPNPTKKVAAEYPAAAKAAGIEGVVKLDVTIGKDGAFVDAKVVSGPEELVPAALAAIKQWQWEPTKLNGKPVEVKTDVNFNFTLAKSQDKSAK